MSIWDLAAARDGAGPTSAPCSSAGCRADATWSIGWRNPRIHDAARVKLWAACDAHRDHLRDWLASRDFPVVVAPFGSTIERLD